MSRSKPTKQEIADRNERVAALRELFADESKEARTVYCVLRSKSKSGMSRTLTLFVIRNGEPYYITYDASIALGWALDKAGNLKVSGCGMDMGFHTVYELAGAIFGHSDRLGYTLKHRWV